VQGASGDAALGEERAEKEMTIVVITEAGNGELGSGGGQGKFSELIETARAKGPQEITRNGKLVGVLVSPEEWKKVKHTPAQNARTASDFCKNSPLAGSGLDLRRSRTKARKLSCEVPSRYRRGVAIYQAASEPSG
jgi:prevent-host-death family protein